MKMTNYRNEKWSLLHFSTDDAMWKRGRALVLAIAVTWMSYVATAQTHPFAGGDGTEANPYQIETPAQLDAIRKSGGNDYLGNHFVLMNDLDFDGYVYTNTERGWLPIGHDQSASGDGFLGTRFTGSFHGKGHVIRNLYINRLSGSTRDFIGLFGALGNPAKIDSLGVEAVNITGRDNVGGLAGLVGTATVQHSYVTGRIEGMDNVGGFAGRIVANATVEENYAAVQVFGNDNVGGLTGNSPGNISNNYALGEVEGNESVGGLVGRNDGTVDTCYAAVKTEGSTNVGGLIGRDESGTYTHNYWNMTVNEVNRGVGSGASDPSNITGITTEQMYVNTSFSGFDFSSSSAWREPDASRTRFPRLRNVEHNGQLLLFPEISPKSLTEGNFTLDYELLPTTLTSGVTFTSQDEAIATINTDGVVTLKAAGEVTLTISRAGTGLYAPIAISHGVFVFPFNDGAGTTDNPYQISTPAQLDSIRNHGDGDGDLNFLDDHYVLTQDLDFDGYNYADAEKGWQPIGHDTVNNTGFQGAAFTGSLNGKGFAIRHLRIDRPQQDYVGVFGQVTDGATIDSLGVEEVDITGRGIVGGLMGGTENSVNIYHSYAQGQIQGRNDVGGLAGALDGTVEECHASLRVQGGDNVGGLIGKTGSGATITDSYATGWITGDTGIGGMVGINTEASIIDSYAAALVEGDNNVGGLVGADLAGTYTTSYWNTAISGQARGAGSGGNDPTGVTALTTSNMYVEGSFTGFDFGNSAPWEPPTANRFPRLRKVTKNAQAIDFPPLAPRKSGSDAFNLTYTLSPASPSGTNLTFESSDETIATINNGKITPQGRTGATLITISRTGNDSYVPLVSLSRRMVVHPFEGGAGIIDNPYLIATPAQLDSIRKYATENFLKDHYALTTNLDFNTYNYANEEGWQPIGHDTRNNVDGHQGTQFTGHFNGRGFTIRNLRINRPTQDYVGLFGYISRGAIDSLGVQDIEVIGNDVVGGLAGLTFSTTISHSYATGSVQGNGQVGGLIGMNTVAALTHKIKTSYAAVQVEGNMQVGGLVGRNIGVIENSYATSLVTGTDEVGGLVGNNLNATISTSYAVGRVIGENNVGGLVGSVSTRAVIITANYWNTQASGQANSAGEATGEIEGLTTQDMYDEGSFSGWDFYDETNNSDGVWTPPTANEHFPLLRGVSKNAQVLAFSPVPLKTPDDPDFTLDYTLLPPLPGVNTRFESTDPTVASVDNNGEVTINKAGVTTLTIHREGNDQYVPLVSQSRTLAVNPFTEGTGTQTDPYQVTTPAQLDFIRDHGGDDLNFLDDHYVLTTALDFSDYAYEDNDKGWQPLGHDTNNERGNFQGTPFTGSFNGKGHVVRHLAATRPNQDYVGLFGNVDSAFKIDSLGVEEVEMTGDQRVGGLVGDITDGDMTNCHAIGRVEGSASVGGLIGVASSPGLISNSYASAQVTSSVIAGGLVGTLDNNNRTIKSSYASAQVTAERQAGGLVGYCLADSIYNCYALGQVTGEAVVGGLVGETRSGSLIGSNYAAVRVKGTSYVGVLVGDNTSVVSDRTFTFAHNYWNADINEQPPSHTDTDGEMEGLSTVEMHEQGSFSGWDFTDVWDSPSDGEHFPHLQAVPKNGQLLVVDLEALLAANSDPFTLNYTLLPPDLGLNTTFESSDEAVATIDNNGTVTIKKTGEANITVRRAGNDDYAPVSVTQPLFVHPFVGGSGTKTDPFQVATPTQLDLIRYHGEGSLNFLDDHYALTQDLDFANYDYADPDKGWLPIAHDTISDNTNYDGTTFTGSFNGKGHVIRNLHIDREEEDYIGLVASADNSFIDSLGMEGLDITGRNHVGGLVGAMSTTTIQRCYAVGQLEGNTNVGGLIGFSFVHGDNLRHAYAVVSVTGVENVGGLVGSSLGTIDTCYASGAVAGTTNVGGLSGRDVGISVGIAVYWNTETSGQSTSSGSIASAGLTTAEMYQEASFANWNFTDVWIPPVEDMNFPYLRGVGSWQSVSIQADPATITEADDATFTLTRYGAGVLLNPLSVDVSITQQGTFLENSEPKTVTFAEGIATATLTVPITDDDVAEANGNVTATLAEGAGYALIEGGAATVAITDNDLPEVSITAEATTATEGEDVVFTLTREGETTGALTVNVDVTQQGDYISGTAPTTVDFVAGEDKATLTVATDDDTTDEADGTITATVESSTAYTLGTPASAETTVTDNDLPMISIAAVDASVTEGTDATFTLTRTTPSGNLTVNVEVTEQGDYIRNTAPTRISFIDGESTTTLMVATEDDATDEPSGAITASVQPGTGYLVGDPSTAEIGIADDDGAADPEVNILATFRSVTEGTNASFTLTRTTTAGNLTVNVEITEQGDYIIGTTPTMATFVNGLATATLTITTDDDAKDEPGGVITATVKPGIGYTLGDSFSAQVGITDNDGEADPEVSITTATPSVLEGTGATFTLTRTITTGALTVNVGITEEGDYIIGTAPTRVDFTDGEPTATLTVATNDDAIDEPGGTITATIKPGTGYTVGDPSSAVIGIADDDGVADPDVTITAAPNNTVAEGTEAEFTLTRTTTTGTLTVNIEVMEQGNYISGVTPTRVAFATGESTTTLTVATEDDAIKEEDGTITATVKLGAGYTIGDPSTASITITDNDDEDNPPPPVGISAEQEAALYPNPVKGQLFIRLPQGGSVAVYTLSGRRERDYRISASKEPVAIDISDLSAGIYIVTLADETGNITHYRVIKF